ncbi:MAG: hypothetical protein IPO80_01725 [Propionibacteriaceae bacterium]|nr:hypothetical protein [Propionibacteriaceae bacterium]
MSSPQPDGRWQEAPDQSLADSIFRPVDDDTVIRPTVGVVPPPAPWQPPAALPSAGGFPPPPAAMPSYHGAFPSPAFPPPDTRPAPPSLAPTVLISLFFGVFGVIPAALHSTRASQLGYPSGRYWGAFAAALAASVVVPLLLFWGVITSFLGPASFPAAAQPVATRTAVVTVPASQPVDDAGTPDVLPDDEPLDGQEAADTPALAPGSWVTVLESISKDNDISVAREQAEAIDEEWGVDVDVLDSDVTPGLNPGWWAVVMTGFDSQGAAQEACAGVGRDNGGACYARRITG